MLPMDNKLSKFGNHEAPVEPSGPALGSQSLSFVSSRTAQPLQPSPANPGRIPEGSDTEDLLVRG